MRNCLKCSSYNDRKGICEVTGKDVSPSDTCECADVERVADIDDNSCSSCKYFNTAGYCRYHRTDTQDVNGCSSYEEQYKNVESDDSQRLHVDSEPDEDGQQFVAIFFSSMFFLAIFVELSKKYPHIIISIILVIVTLFSALYGWTIGGKVSRIISLIFFLLTIIVLLYFFGDGICGSILKEKISIIERYYI